MKPIRFRALLAAGLISPLGALAGSMDAILADIKLPPGFKISVFAEVPRARSIGVGAPPTTVYIGSRHGTIHALRDTNRDGVADEVKERASGLNVPNGIAYLNSVLYVGERTRVSKWPVPAEWDAALSIKPLVPIFEDLPDKSWHGWRYMKFGPDGKLYVAVGSPCNICDVKGIEGTIIRMDPEGKNVEIVARGVRNSVGMDFHPKTGMLFFTDNGADMMGDDIPPDELNQVTKIGQHFGFPYLGGKSVRLTGYEKKTAPADAVPPVIEFQAHTASLGMHFYRGDMFPAEYKHDAFVAQHGSWNRTSPVGYRVMRVRFDSAGNAKSKEVFAEGWLKNGVASGRPVDINELPDGSMIVSDDYAGVIYRISYDR